MSAVPQDSSTEGVPGMSGIPKARHESSSEDFKFCTETCFVPARDSNHGTRRVSCRAEIDTSPPFESVKEAVIRFGGSGPWVPFYKFGEHGIEEFDIKKVEEEAAELEKDLIMKELETLDVLEELGATKRIVEDLKRQLKDEASKYTTKTPYLNNEHVGIEPYCPVSSHDSNSLELKQAELNLGKTINDLGMIQVRVKSLNKKMKNERLACTSRSMLLLEKTVEMRLFAAKKMEEAAMAAEALALVELNALGGAKGLSSNETSSDLDQSPRSKFDEENNILRKLEQASEEIEHYKKALKEALKSVKIASKKQLDIEEALEKWIPRHEHDKHVVHNGSKINNHPRSPLKDLMNKQKQDVDDDPNHVTPRECVGIIETKKVASSRMVDEQKQDLRHQRRKFGFIHIHWQSKAKKKAQALNTM